MQCSIDEVSKRIAELERLISITPLAKGFSLQARLVEAKYILDLLKSIAKK
jgi:hypothetical protein